MKEGGENGRKEDSREMVSFKSAGQKFKMRPYGKILGLHFFSLK